MNGRQTKINVDFFTKRTRVFILLLKVKLSKNLETGTFFVYSTLAGARGINCMHFGFYIFHYNELISKDRHVVSMTFFLELKENNPVIHVFA